MNSQHMTICDSTITSSAYEDGLEYLEAIASLLESLAEYGT